MVDNVVHGEEVSGQWESDGVEVKGEAVPPHLDR